MHAAKLATATNLAPADKTDRRRDPRVPVNRPARIRVDNGPPAMAQLMNVSTRGAALFYSAPLAAGTVVWLRLNLRTGAKAVSLKLTGVVRQSHLFGESHLIRVVFTNPRLDAVQIILEYMKSQPEPAQTRQPCQLHRLFSPPAAR